MDLIFTNAAKEDVGVLFDYEFDLAFGENENDFELTIQQSAHCIEPGSFIYIEGTEYGGIVDSIAVNTVQQSITYSGRTWHGILAGNVIEPDVGYDYFIVNGDANVIISTLIDKLGLSDLFVASPEVSDIKVAEYAFHRYTDAYKGIRQMLAENSGKLKFEHRTDKVVLSAVYLADYSQNEEFDDSQVDFSVKKNFKPTNHLICLGSGNLKNRYVIHLFTDENGGIQPFKTTEKPLSDADYILDTSHQVLFGVDEVADVYDFPSAQTTENFVKLTEQPSDWASNYAAYFTQDEDDRYINVEGVPEEQATVLTVQPSDWAEKFGKYFALIDGKYKTVEAVTVDEYRMQTQKPDDWETNYQNYFTYFTDGVEDHWDAVRAESATRYNVQTKRPSDWSTNFGNYYRYSWNDEVGYHYVKVTWDYRWDEETEEYFQVIPAWQPSKFYTAEKYSVAPVWQRNKYYTIDPKTGAPEFTSDTFYSVKTVIVNPPFAVNKYFIKKFDHFAELVSGAVEKLKDSFNCNSISIALDLEGSYDIGDIVGATEHTTGIAVWQPITKKIVTIKNSRETVNYEIGKVI